MLKKIGVDLGILAIAVAIVVVPLMAVLLAFAPKNAYEATANNFAMAQTPTETLAAGAALYAALFVCGLLVGGLVRALVGYERD